MNISILLILLVVSATTGMAAIDNNIQPKVVNIDIQKLADNLAENVKKVDYSKMSIKDIKDIDIPIITEDWITGIGRIDYIYHTDFNVTQRTSSLTTSPSYCYGKFGKWYTLSVNYIINPSNEQGLSESLITSSMAPSAETWDSATSKELFSNSYEIDYNAPIGIYDGRNVIGIGPYRDSRVIAVTSVWYNIYSRQIFEFDMRFNSAFTWGDATTNSYPYLMDIRNIATHEFGHTVGLKDLYSWSCSQATMYGYSGYRETKKRTLENGDITGIRLIYGT